MTLKEPDYVVLIMKIYGRWSMWRGRTHIGDTRECLGSW